MATMVLVMAAGLILVLTSFIVLRGALGLSPLAAGLGNALIITGLYFPFGIVFWPGADVFAMQLVFFLGVTYVMASAAKARDEAAEKTGVRPRGIHWAPATIVGFFGFLFVALSGFVVIAEQGLPRVLAERLLPEPSGTQVATSAFPGSVVRDVSRSEDQFDYIQRLAEQRDRGWSVDYGWVGEAPEPGGEGTVRLKVQDSSGRPVSGAEVSGVFMRPDDDRYDQAMAAQEVDRGVYEGQVALDKSGLWLVLFDIEQGDVHHEVKGRARIGSTLGAR